MKNLGGIPQKPLIEPPIIFEPFVALTPKPCNKRILIESEDELVWGQWQDYSGDSHIYIGFVCPVCGLGHTLEEFNNTGEEVKFGDPQTILWKLAERNPNRSCTRISQATRRTVKRKSDHSRWPKDFTGVE